MMLGRIENASTAVQFREFQNGPIYWSPAGGAHPVVNHFFACWQRNGWEGGVLKYPTTDEIPSANGGRYQEFQGGTIYWHANEGYYVTGAIRDKWRQAGGEGGPLGYPTSDELAAGKYNGRFNNFENGTVTWSSQTGSRLMFGPTRDRWAEVGRENGEMGYPLADEQIAPDGVGHFTRFENGSAIYAHPILGAWRVPANILAVWATVKYERGKLGYPIGLPQVVGSVIRQDFERGVAAFSPSKMQGFIINVPAS